MAPKWWQLMLHNDPLGRHLQYTPNIASLDHLTENVHNVLGQIWQATRQNPSTISNTGLVIKRGSMKGTFTLYYNIFTLHCLP